MWVRRTLTAIQLVYQYFDRSQAVALNPPLVEALWIDFVTELETPFWVTRCVTNLRYLECENSHVQLVDNVAVYGRSPETIASLGFQAAIWERLAADWGSFGASSFVLVAESKAEKRPDNFLLVDSNAVWTPSARTIGALRLVAAGEVGMSVAFVQRISRFNVGTGGVLSVGAKVDTLGSSFLLTTQHLESFRSTYKALERLEMIGYRKAPGNLDLALRAFMSTYDRFPSAMDTKLVDSITALEAVLGTDSEIAFKLSFRVASLLAKTDEERAPLMKSIKGFYDARSRIVHGGRPGKKQTAYLAAVDELRSIVRELLVAFVRFASDDSRSLNKNFFSEELDASLIANSSRDTLRTILTLKASD